MLVISVVVVVIFFEGYVIPNEVGELDGAVVFTYEDSTGQKQEVKKRIFP